MALDVGSDVELGDELELAVRKLGSQLEPERVECLEQLLVELERVATRKGYALFPILPHMEAPGEETFAVITRGKLKMVLFNAPAFLETVERAMDTAHEVGHLVRGGSSWLSKYLQREEAAWDWARELFRRLELPWSEAHVEKVLAQNRSALEPLFICDTCGTRALEIAPREFLCTQCLHRWWVPLGGKIKVFTLQKFLPSGESVKTASR